MTATPSQLRDEIRGPFTLVASAARTATHSTNWVENQRGRGIIIHIDVTTSSLTPSVVMTLQGKDHTDGAYTILASKAFTGAAEKDTLYVYPGAPNTAEESAPAILPRYWRITATHADTDSITYSVGYSLLP